MGKCIAVSELYMTMFISVSGLVLILATNILETSGWCSYAYGTSGNGGDKMDASCTHDFYDAGVIEYKEADAICINDKCYCVFAKGYCNHAFMKTDPYCCTPGFTAENCDNAVCDTNGSCHHE